MKVNASDRLSSLSICMFLCFRSWAELAFRVFFWGGGAHITSVGAKNALTYEGLFFLHLVINWHSL